MKKYKILLLIVLLVSINAFSQIYEPVTWSTSVEKISENEFILIAKAAIEPSWHLYAQDVPENGPIPTLFDYNNSEHSFELIGNTEGPKGHTVLDPVFEMEITYFETKAEFEQKIIVTNSIGVINGSVRFMACDDQRCLPPETVELKYTIPGVNKTKGNKRKTIISAPSNQSKSTKDIGLLRIFLLAFASGFAALLTPCVFPMIPMTVSFFTKQSKTRVSGIKNAIIYCLAIIIIYVLLGSLVTAIFGADALNALSTNVWFNLIFFLLLVLFASSFLGAFELILPSTWATKVDAQADRGGVIGIFFMALALAIVSFSCTGPIVGTLLVEAASKGGIAPIIGMLGFSSAIALPFALFAAFPGWLQSLPRSGGWLNTVKVVLGFLELALAFKFLSNADLVLQLHLLEREVFIAIWIAIFGALALYLFGKIQLPHDSPITHISVGRLSLGLLVTAFTIYLIPGIWGAPLKLISGFPPPMHYSESPHGVGYMKVSTPISKTSGLPEGAKYGPHDIVSFLDYDKGVAYAKSVGKPILLDFTGHACVNCRKMEERVWSEAKILNILKNEIVLISLYVDDKRLLPEEEQYVSETTGKKIKSIGNKWSDFQIKKYKANAQPFYVLLNHEEEKLNLPMAYEPDIEVYYNWLNEGLKQF